MDGFGADAHADEPGGEAAEDGMRSEEAEDQGWFEGGWVSEEGAEVAVRDGLECLGDAGGEFAAVLDLGEGELGDDGSGGPGGERLGEDAGGGYGVLNGEVDADASGG